MIGGGAVLPTTQWRQLDGVCSEVDDFLIVVIANEEEYANAFATSDRYTENFNPSLTLQFGWGVSNCKLPSPDVNVSPMVSLITLPRSSFRTAADREAGFLIKKVLLSFQVLRGSSKLIIEDVEVKRSRFILVGRLFKQAGDRG